MNKNPVGKVGSKVQRKHKKKPANPPSKMSVDSSKDLMAGPKRKHYPKLIDHSALLALRSYHSVRRMSKDPYESRTFDSTDIAADMDSQGETLHRQHRKRKAELIDSEVDLFKKDNTGVPIKFSAIHPKYAQKTDSKLSPTKQKEKNKEPPTELPTTKSGLPKTDSTAKKPSTLGSPNQASQLKKLSNEARLTGATEDIMVKYPVLKDQELVNKFLRVSLNNNQKGRIRQVIREITKGTSPNHLPDVLNNRIQVILRSSDNLTDTDLRKIRILYNMLNTVTVNQKLLENQAHETPKKKKKKGTEDGKEPKKDKDGKELQKPKKRYVVFVGNLPKDVTKEQVMDHFADLGDFVKGVRLPAKKEDKNSSIAYVELSTGTSYEMALSKNHSMFGNRRINVLYTAPKNSKMTKTQAKGKGAKLAAMAKNGQLVGSIALTKKRSQRRAKARLARKAAEQTQSI